MSQEKLNSLIESDYEVKIGYYFSEGYELFKKNAGGFIGMSFMVLVFYGVSAAISMIPVLGIFASLGFSVCMYLIMAGFLIVIKKVRNNEPYEFKDFFSAFNGTIAGPIVALNIISGILTVIGFVLCVLPGIYLSIAYTFGIYILLFFKIDFWESLEFSRKIVSKKWFTFFWLFILLGLLNLGGLILVGVGLFVTIPWTFCILYITFEDIFKPGSDSFENKIDSFGMQQKDINTEADERNR